MKPLVIGLGAWCVISVPVGLAFGRVMRSRFAESSNRHEQPAPRETAVPDERIHRQERSTVHVA